MARLFRLDGKGDLSGAEEKPFESEPNEMEPFLKRNARILGDVLIFGEQTISSGRDKRTDLLGVDKNRDVLVIELKKDYAGKEILSQILDYSHYWKTHPGDAKNVWNDFKQKNPTVENEPDWDNYQPRMVVVCPSIDPELVQIATSHDLDIRFFEIARYQHDGSTFVLVDEVEQPTQRERAVSSRQDYDWSWFAEEIAYSDVEVRLAKWLHEELHRLSQSRGWNVAPKFNKGYIAFQRGGRNSFWIEVRHKGKVTIGIQWRDKSVVPSGSSGSKWQWDKNYEHWFIEIESADFNINSIVTALDQAVQNIVRG